MEVFSVVFRKRQYVGCRVNWVRRLPEDNGSRWRTGAARSQWRRWSAVTSISLLSLVLGCLPNESIKTESPTENSSQIGLVPHGRQYEWVPEYELMQLVSRTQKPLVVEFGVDFNCHRCDQMESVLNELRQRFGDQVKIVRANFDRASSMQAQLGLNVCPSYLFYLDGKLVDRHDGPTPLPILSSKLGRLLPATNPSELAPQRVDSGEGEVAP